MAIALDCGWSCWQGRTLEQLLGSQGTFGPAEAAVIGQELCRALGAVHAAGLVHRDIKATNVMREPGGRLVLMDFGTGYRVDVAERSRVELVGTPLYLAPEVLAGGSATPRSDIYSLGVLLYHLATGKYPVTAASVDELRGAHGRHESQRLGDVRPDLPDAFVSVVDRALHHDPQQRFASAGEMHAALAVAATSESQAPPTAGSRPWRRDLLAAATTLGLALMVVALATALWRGRGNPSHTRRRSKSTCPARDHAVPERLHGSGRSLPGERGADGADGQAGTGWRAQGRALDFHEAFWRRRTGPARRSDVANQG